MGARFSPTCPDRPWGPPSLLYDGYRVFPGDKEWRWRDADTSPLLVPWSRKSTAIPLLSLWACTELQCLYRVHFTFTFLTHTISQTKFPALLDRCVTNTPSVKMSCPQNSYLSLHCRKNITCLTVGLLRISEVKVKFAP